MQNTNAPKRRERLKLPCDRQNRDADPGGISASSPGSWSAPRESRRDTSSRYGWRSKTSVGILAICALSLLPTQLFAQRWDGYGGNERNHNIDPSAIPDSISPVLTWSTSLGQGRSGIVTDGKSIYTTFRKPIPDSDSKSKPSPKAHVEVIASLNSDTAQERWRYEYDAGFLEEQQTFSGRDRAPQSTPLLVDDPIAGAIVVSIGFTGKLHAVSQADGQLIWSIDLVKQLGATPVAFGFSSSPILVDQQLIVLAGGATNDSSDPVNKGGLISIRPSDGQVLWNVTCGEASYATPVVADFDGQKQIVVVTRQRLLGVSPTGMTLWEKPLPKSGLTNVPTPLVTENGLILSGQGIGGTTRWDVERTGQQWKISEAWFSDTQFFYCNWILVNHHILGCSNNLLQVIDATSGKTLGKWRGYADSNIATSGDRIFVTHGDGSLSGFRMLENGFDSIGSWKILKERCWTPPAFADGKAFFRMGESIHCVSWNKDHTRPTTTTVSKPLAKIKSRKEFRFKTLSSSMPPKVATTTLAPLARIQAAYENDGVQAAIDVYHNIRESNPTALGLESRKTLQQLAIQVGQNEFANQLPGHAFADMPNDITKNWLLTEAKKQLQSKNESPDGFSSVGKNSLRYLKFAIVNIGDRRDAIVKGPPAHPFGYGLPLRTGQVRHETWPVGTRLTDESTGETLLRIKDSDAGQILVIQP